MTTVITLTDHSLHFRLSVTPKTVCVCVGGAGVTCCSDQHQLLEEPSKIFAVNVVMREGEHKAEKGSSENGVNGPEVTQLEVGKLGWSPVAGLLAGSPDQSRTQPPRPLGWDPHRVVESAQSGGARTECELGALGVPALKEDSHLMQRAWNFVGSLGGRGVVAGGDTPHLPA